MTKSILIQKVNNNYSAYEAHHNHRLVAQSQHLDELCKSLGSYFDPPLSFEEMAEAEMERDFQSERRIHMTINGKAVTAHHRGKVFLEDSYPEVLLNIQSVLEKIRTLTPKVGDTYYYIRCGSTFPDVAVDSLDQSQVDYINSTGKLPLNVFQTRTQAKQAADKLLSMFKDFQGEWSDS